MPRCQSAYRHWTESALAVVFLDIIQVLDSGNVALISVLDMSAAFDCVDHDILLQAILSHAFDWLSTYLRARSQHVRSGGKSTVSEVQSASGIRSLATAVHTLYCRHRQEHRIALPLISLLRRQTRRAG